MPKEERERFVGGPPAFVDVAENEAGEMDAAGAVDPPEEIEVDVERLEEADAPSRLGISEVSFVVVLEPKDDRAPIGPFGGRRAVEKIG